jgi:hypothetical protein
MTIVFRNCARTPPNATIVNNVRHICPISLCFHAGGIVIGGIPFSSIFLANASGVNTITGSAVVSEVGAAIVGSPTGTVIMAVPFGIVIVMVVRDLAGRKQYPRSTQLSPPSPLFFGWKVGPALFAVTDGVTFVK